MTLLTQYQYSLLSPSDQVIYNAQVSAQSSISTAMKIRYGIGVLGSVAGILLAVHRKSGFWGGLGWFLVGGAAGSGVGYLVTSGMKENT